jgi:hypothetical protein
MLKCTDKQCLAQDYDDFPKTFVAFSICVC